jgi:HAD superfamily hydrolase (TIGR01549 family)
VQARPVAAVVFDVDGTLVDSLDIVVDCYRRIVRELDGSDRSTDEILAAFSIGPARAMLAYVIGRPVGEDAVTRYEALLRDRCDEIRPFPGVADAIARLAETLPLAIFTAADTGAAEITLGATGLRSSFAHVVGADEVRRTKPAPDGLIEAARRLGLGPADVAYVGDSPSDAITARACGAVSVAAGWGHQHHVAPDADLVAGSPADLVALLLPSDLAPAEP